MNRNVIFFIGIAFASVIILTTAFLYISNQKSSQNTPNLTRETVPITVNNNDNQSTPNVEANKSPKFVIDITEDKFNEILNASGNKINELVEAKIVNVAHADEKVDAYITVDKNDKKLNVQPEDLNNFKPGLYKLSLKLRTLEGEVDLDQDFTWGVIAVNTNKSIYKPNENVKIGFGVLNDAGETLCLTGEKTIDELNMTIKNPTGQITSFSTKNNSIKDSGKCGPITFTNEADFQTSFTTSQTGIYQMTIEAVVNGKKRQITDYFKVEQDPEFDIERSDFPTRIYPKRIYPTAITVTAKSNYNGTIIDTVPAFFKIENISDGGKVTKIGNFQQITWNTNLAAGKPRIFTYFIKFPQISPEFYLLGPITIGNFKEARQWQIASDAINSTSGVLAYEDNGGSDTWYNIWTGTAFNAQADMDTVGDAPDDSRWFVEKSSPKTGEKLVAAFDNSSSPAAGTERIWVYRWTGSAWSEDFYVDTNTNDLNTKPMDIAYEELSGEALLVYGDTTNDLKYYRRSGGSWTGPFVAGTSVDSRKRWVRAVSQFESDTIVVAYLNLNERIGAQIWDGSTNTWGDQFEDDDSPAQSETAASDEQSFDVAIETQSGTPMIFWGNTSQQLLYRQFTGGAWSGESTLYTTDTDAANDIEWVTAAADPVSTSNYISLAMQEELDDDATDEAIDCHFGMWTGSAGETLPAAITCRSDNDGRLISTAFENTGSRAMFVYNTSANTNSLTYRTWTAGDASPGTSTDITGDVNTGDVIDSVQLHSDLNTKSMIALAADSDTGGSGSDLFYWSWEGAVSTWTMNTTPIHDGVQNTGENAEAYGYGFDRNLEKQVAYRWFANNNGTSVTTALTAQDTPYTLTSANQAFRLRLLLFTPDTITTSLRNYKLQYVDPGNGTCASPTSGTPSTWTDVPTSGGTTISFNNNATPADGDNLTVNGSLDPTYRGLTVNAQDYEEANNFTNTVSSIPADQLGLWDFSLIDNTTYDRIAQTYCFRVARSNDVVVQIGLYPQISTAALPDVLIQGGSLIQGGTRINNP